MKSKKTKKIANRHVFLLIALFSSVSLSFSQENVLDNNLLKETSTFQSYVSDSNKVNISIPKDSIPRFIKISKEYLNTSYQFSGNGGSGIDCSGLVYNCLNKIGFNSARRAHEQAFFGRIIVNENDLMEGDIMFFTDTYKSNHFITHTGIYLGEGNFIHASSSRGVIITNMLSSSYWKPKFVFAKRYFL